MKHGFMRLMLLLFLAFLILAFSASKALSDSADSYCTGTTLGLGTFCASPLEGPPGTAIEIRGYFYNDFPSLQLFVHWDWNNIFGESITQEFVGTLNDNLIGYVHVPVTAAPGQRNMAIETCCPAYAFFSFNVTDRSVSQHAYPTDQVFERPFPQSTDISGENPGGSVPEAATVGSTSRLPSTGMGLIIPVAAFILLGAGGWLFRKLSL